MTFKWTYIAWVMLVVAVGAAMALVVDDEGRAGTFGWVLALGAIGTGAVIVFLTRRRRPPTLRESDTDVPFISYPEHQVLAVLDSRDAAAEAIRELRARHSATDLTVYYGTEGAATIDSEGVAHGAVGVVERSVEHLVADLDDMRAYDSAVRQGKVVIAFDGSDEEVRHTSAEVLMARGAHTIQYFGPLAIEVLDVDRSRTRMSPDPTTQQAQQRGRTEA